MFFFQCIFSRICLTFWFPLESLSAQTLEIYFERLSSRSIFFVMLFSLISTFRYILSNSFLFSFDTNEFQTDVASNFFMDRIGSAQMRQKGANKCQNLIPNKKNNMWHLQIRQISTKYSKGTIRAFEHAPNVTNKIDTKMHQTDLYMHPCDMLEFHLCAICNHVRHKCTGTKTCDANMLSSLISHFSLHAFSLGFA